MVGFPRLFLWTILLFAGGATIYYGAVISGMFKNPLMAHFRRYGEDLNLYPVCRLLAAAGLFCLMIAMLMYNIMQPTSYFYRLFPPSLFLILTIIFFGANLLIRRQPTLREALPVWYHDLMHNSTRQERRQLAFAWLRVSYRLRWRLNSDQSSFRVWAELVRLTVIYGAYDPKSAWDNWT